MFIGRFIAVGTLLHEKGDWGIEKANLFGSHESGL
jgi:hypothetical protein